MVAVYVFIGYVVIQVLYLGVWCRPFTNYWAIPVPADQEQCKTYLHHMIVVTVFNVSSDLAMLCIPVPLIARSRLPLKRKLVLCGVFSMGILTVLVAILNRYFNFTESYSMIFLNWYNAEACTAVLIANIPFCWSLLRRVFRLGAWDPDKNSDEAESGFATGQHPPTIGHAIWGGADRRRRTGETTILGLDTTVTANTANEIPDAAASPKRVSTGGTTEKSAAFTRDSQHEPSLFRPADGDGKTDSK